MEFHIARAIRDKASVDGVLFSYTGNVVFADVAASRRLAEKLNALREDQTDERTRVHGGALFAMGIIDELSHALVALYRKKFDPKVLPDQLRWMAKMTGAENVEKLLAEFTTRFPNSEIYRGKVTEKEWLERASEGMPNREAALEEMMLLWLANLNPAFTTFRKLFDDRELKKATVYEGVTLKLPEYFVTRPKMTPAEGTLLDVLMAPMLASPDSITGQLEYIRVHWAEHLGDLDKLLLAIDTLREEERALWLLYHPPERGKHGHGEGGGNLGFEGDEYTAFNDSLRRRRRYAHDYQAPLEEYEAFSSDQEWMPNVVMIAKSTYVWLEQLSQKYGRHIHRLDQIPIEELRLLADRGINSLWLIGLWERSTASKTIKQLCGQHDAVASAYSLKSYHIAADIGGDEGYRVLKERAMEAGLRLASDMVPNHMGIDSDWVIEHPDWFLQRPESPFPSYRFDGPNLSSDNRVEIKIEDKYFDRTDAAVVFRLRHYNDFHTRYVYHGNDGTSFAWNDTAQLDYSKAHVREQVIQTILHVARLFPIIRFDAAMTLAKRHVQRLWFPLPGAGGSIPSRAESAISQEEFDELMPHEFWREVVDRVAVEVPGTLLLAEAFWLLEGYFVRTLGMHRVYNSAFMNMLRDEENAKYRSVIKKTCEFDPDIMKRYVNFMSNPDERTAIDQFGTGDKYFGACTLMATLPGLPMFGHGQIEGYTERYGMEFKQARMRESVNEELVARHQREIAPLLKERWLFSESRNFVLYDFYNEFGLVDENVFAYSNRRGGKRALILYNNSYGGRKGTIRISAAGLDKATGKLHQQRVSEGLGVTGDDNAVLAYRDTATGLEYLTRASRLYHDGMTFDLRGYQYAVLVDWREMWNAWDKPWLELCDKLDGRGVPSVDAEFARFQLRPVFAALGRALERGTVAGLLDAVTAKKKAAAEASARRFADAVTEFYKAVIETMPGLIMGGSESALREMAAGAAAEAVRVLAELKMVSVARSVPVAAWCALRLMPLAKPGTIAAAEAFDALHLREALAECEERAGAEHVESWRGAARVRILLTQTDALARASAGEPVLWGDGDVRWLAGVNTFEGVEYVGLEAFAALLDWLKLPALASGKAAAVKSAAAAAKKSTAELKKAGFRLRVFTGAEVAAPVKTAARSKSAVKKAAVKAPAKKASAKPKATVKTPAKKTVAKKAAAKPEKKASKPVLKKKAAAKPAKKKTTKKK